VDVRATRRGVPAAVLWGALGVLAWATLAVFLGGGSAHADDRDDGPLDGLTSLVGDTVSSVTAPVKPVVTEVVAPVVTKVVAPVVTKAVAPVVTKVVAPVQQTAPAVVETVTETVAATPVVGTVTAPVVQAVTETAHDVVAPVTAVLSDAPVSQITDPLLDTVAGLPLVGGLVTDLGVITTVDDLVDVVDDTTAILGGAVDSTVPPVLDALDPTTPDPALGSGVVVEPSTPGATTVAPRDEAAPGPAPFSASSRVLGGAAFVATAPPVSTGSSDTVGSGADATGAPENSPPGTLPGGPVPASSSAGSGGGSGAAHARLSDVDPSPLRAGERTSGASDDALPTSPVADTDVSPD